jgi:hypothetical protein
MNPIPQRSAVWLVVLVVITLIVILIWGCGASMSASRAGFSPAPVLATPAPGIIVVVSNPDYTNAQATLDAGQNQLLDLGRKATEVSLLKDQAANAAAQATQDFNQRQQMELDHQATVISLHIEQAAATQKFVRQQTKNARDVTAIAQNKAAKATYLAYQVNVTQTAQAQEFINGQVLRTDQAAAAATAYWLTATPLAGTQTALLMQQYDREQKAFVDRIVIPSIPVVAAILFILLFILVIVLVNRRLIPLPFARRLWIGRVNPDPNSVVMIDGVLSDHTLPLHQENSASQTPVSLPLLPCEKTVHVEIVDAAGPPVAHWIAEVERQLAAEGGL